MEFEYENKKLYSMIKMPYLSMDNYLYDFELKEKEMEDKSIFNKKQKLNVKEQFEVYKNFLEKDLKIKQKDNKEWKNLLFSTFILFKDDFAFNFYIIIFNECISSPICRCKIISYFEPKKIIEIGEIDERNKKMATNYINMFKKNPKNFMTYCKDEIETHRIGIKLFAFILFYYYKYIRKEFPKLLENKDEKSIIYINNVLMSYRYLFMDIKLTKERVLELINISTSFIDLTNSVEYLDTLQDLLDVILFNFEKFKILYIKEIDKDIIIMIDNCYCEFVGIKEPTEVGADIVVGSLIKNLGGGIAPNGAYIVGKKDLIELCAERLTLPGEGKEVGPTLGINKQFLQGLYLAPKVVANALKTSILTSKVLETLGYEVEPKYNEQRADIVQNIIFNDEQKLIKYCQGIQAGSAIDSYVEPVPWEMPGYTDKVIMAAGTFTQGSSIELSCDGPIRAPYIAYQQGSLTYEYGKIGLSKAIEKLEEK